MRWQDARREELKERLRRARVETGFEEDRVAEEEGSEVTEVTETDEEEMGDEGGVVGEEMDVGRGG